MFFKCFESEQIPVLISLNNIKVVMSFILLDASKEDIEFQYMDIAMMNHPYRKSSNLKTTKVFFINVLIRKAIYKSQVISNKKQI